MKEKQRRMAAQEVEAPLGQQQTGPSRYILNVPGNGSKPCFMNDPQLRLQKWGANLKSVVNGGPIDIDSDLVGLNNGSSKYNTKKRFPFNQNINSKIKYLPNRQGERYASALTNLSFSNKIYKGEVIDLIKL